MSAVQIVSINDDGTLKLNSQILETILSREDVKNTSISIVSVVGDPLRGKSFLLNFFLRYLNHNRHHNWLQVDTDATLEGFSWKVGDRQNLTGIWMWSEPFKITTRDGREIAVLLMETPGASFGDLTSLFTFITMISSIVIFNKMRDLQESDLENLHQFTQHVRNALNSRSEIPVQKFIILIRDWEYISAFVYGFGGGIEYLNKLLSKQRRKLRFVRENLEFVFQNIRCFLMPYPGDNIWKDAEFEGQISRVNQDFLDSLNELIPCVLNDGNIEVKRVISENGTFRVLTGEEMLIYICECFDSCKM